MSFLNKLKSLFISAKEGAEPLFDQTKESITDIKNKLGDSTEYLGNKAAEFSEEKLSKTQEFTEKVGRKVHKKGSELKEKAIDFAEKVGEDIIDTADDLYDRGKDKAAELYEQGKDKAENILEKAQDKYDDLFEKAKAQDIIDSQTPEYSKVSHAEKLRETDILEGSDSFFDKAKKFAEGDYEGVREGMIEVSESTVKIEKEVDDRITAGFEDLDGDGDEIIDDAILDKEDDTKGEG